MRILILILVLVSGCSSEAEKKYHAERAKREWIRTDKGVDYFKQCIDGKMFYAVHDQWGQSLAGPVGSCFLTKGE